MYTLKKSLGQHFLKDDSISVRIVDALREKPFTKLLEVGPGGGALTRHLINLQDVDFKAVEIDEEKIEYLLTQYPVLKNRIITASMLEMEMPFEGHFTVVGNFPYNISTQIVFKILDWRNNVDTMVGMFQKEVAIRIAASPGNKDYGILSVLAGAFFRIEYLFEVDENAFNPPPKVKSAVIRLTNTGNPFHIENYAKFLWLVKTAFGQRRKQLRNPLKSYFSADVLQDPVFTKRAEQLSVADYVELMKRLK